MNYTPGLHQVSDHCHAWLQPGGGFCLSNAGVLAVNGQTLLIDTLIDLPRTGAMLEAMAASVPGADRIDTLVNTHAHPDHTAGNTLLPDSRIIMSSACAREYRHIETMVRLDRIEGDALLMLKELGVERFESEGVVHVPPSQLFDGELHLRIGDVPVHLVEIGPSHALSDTLVYVPSEAVAFTGDMMFSDCHLVLNHPSVRNWIDACERLLSWEIDTIIPGHGRVCDKTEVQRHLDYLLFLKEEARRRYDLGMPLDIAAMDLFENLGRFSHLLRADLLYKNVAALYAEFAGWTMAGGFPEHMADRWRFRNRIRGRAPGIHVNHIPDGN